MSIQRNNILTVIRDFSMILIVLYHCMCYSVGIWDFNAHPISSLGPIAGMMSSIGLTFFVLISGFLYETILTQSNTYNDNSRFIKKKFKRLLIPYLIWGGNDSVPRI